MVKNEEQIKTLHHERFIARVLDDEIASLVDALQDELKNEDLMEAIATTNQIKKMIQRLETTKLNIKIAERYEDYHHTRDHR